jgi:hydrogenase nickel incorporation protein HypA/HybF
VHEMSYCEGVLEAVERRAGGRPVARVRVRIGVVHRVVADAFAQSFEMAAAGGVAAGAVTEVVTIPVQGSCSACGTTFETAEPHPACPSCGALDVTTEGGDEVILELIEYRDDEAEQAAETVPEHTHGLNEDHHHAGSTAAGGH